MRILIVTALLAAGGSVHSSGQPRPSSAQSVFRSGIELVTLHVTVTDRRQRYVTGITENEFRIYEDGRRQELKYFSPSGLPLALTLMLDTSASMRHALPRVRDGAADLIRHLAPDDMASIVTFADSFKVLKDLTGDKRALLAALTRLEQGESTRLYSAVYIALKEIRKAPAITDAGAPRRRAIVLMSDGDDSSSTIRFDELMDQAVRANTVIYAVRLGRRYMGDDATNRAAFELRRMCELTGGRAFFPVQSYELPDIYREIIAELSSQYALAYESSDVRRDGRFRNLSVQVDRVDAVARTRRGYFAGGN
jgi:Ca-activated chloride channel family protein